MGGAVSSCAPPPSGGQTEDPTTSPENGVELGTVAPVAEDPTKYTLLATPGEIKAQYRVLVKAALASVQSSEPNIKTLSGLQLVSLSKGVMNQVDNEIEMLRRARAQGKDVDTLPVLVNIMYSMFVKDVSDFVEDTDIPNANHQRVIEAFDVCRQLKSLHHDLHLLVPDVDEVSLVELFGPFLSRFLEITHEQLVVWTHRAAAGETWTRIEGLDISCSVVDVFSGLDSPTSFFKSFSWLLVQSHALMVQVLEDYASLVYNVLKGYFELVFISMTQYLPELEATALLNNQFESVFARDTDLAKRKKSRMKKLKFLEKGKGKDKDKEDLLSVSSTKARGDSMSAFTEDEGPTDELITIKQARKLNHVRPQICVVLNNFECCRTKLDDILRDVEKAYMDAKAEWEYDHSEEEDGGGGGGGGGGAGYGSDFVQFGAKGFPIDEKFASLFTYLRESSERVAQLVVYDIHCFFSPTFEQELLHLDPDLIGLDDDPYYQDFPTAAMIKPLLIYLETQFSFLYSNLCPTGCQRALKMVWNLVVWRFEVAFVPSDVKRGLHDEQVKAAARLLEEMIPFFHGDGEGPSKKWLRAQSTVAEAYSQLYNVPTEAVTFLHQSLLENPPAANDPAALSPDRILLILALREKDKEAVKYVKEVEKNAKRASKMKK